MFIKVATLNWRFSNLFWNVASVAFLFFSSRKSSLHLSIWLYWWVKSSWDLKEESTDTDGRTWGGQTAKFFIIIHSGREYFGSKPKSWQSKSDIFENICMTSSGEISLVFSWLFSSSWSSSFLTDSSIVIFKFSLLNVGWMWLHPILA